jgi:hypothetical protein
MRVLICGGRFYTNKQRMCDVVSALPQETTIVTGGARGADNLAEQCAYNAGMAYETHYPNWHKHGKAAGPIRNQEMIDSGIDKVIAFPGGYGTADLRRRARAAGVPVEEIDAPTHMNEKEFWNG